MCITLYKGGTSNFSLLYSKMLQWWLAKSGIIHSQERANKEPSFLSGSRNARPVAIDKGISSLAAHKGDLVSASGLQPDHGGPWDCGDGSRRSHRPPFSSQLPNLGSNRFFVFSPTTSLAFFLKQILIPRTLLECLESYCVLPLRDNICRFCVVHLGSILTP